MTFGQEADEWLGRVLGVPNRRFKMRRMKGATSSSVFRVTTYQDSPSRRFVLRVLDNPTWLAEEPDLASHEATALGEARKMGLPVPELVAYSSEEVGFGAPVVLMSCLAGRVELRPADLPCWLDGLAGRLAVIHRHAADGFPWRYRCWLNRAALASPTWTAVSHRWVRAIEIAQGAEPDCAPVFLHRDYHPTNVLWRAGTVSGVVDWINACQGPAGVDVAHCRTNLALMLGPKTADRFLVAYKAAADGYDHNPYWDIVSLLDMTLPQPGFYHPWQEFGLEVIAPETLRLRAEDYLERVIQDVG